MIKKLSLIAFLAFAAVEASAQYPGGISSGLKFWIKANGGVTVVSNTVPQWNDLSGAGVTGNLSTTAVLTGNTAPAYVPAGINFNPHVAFNQTQPNSLCTSTPFAGNSLFDAANTTVLQVIKLHTFSGTGVWMKWENANTGSRLGFEVNNGSNLGQLRFDFNGTVYAPGNVNDKYVLADFFMNPTQKGVIVNGATAVSVTGTNNSTTCVGKLSIGNEPSISTPACITPQSVDPYPTTIDIAEIMIFNRSLTAAERNKAESYLAVKYGITLDQSTTYANNYTSANGTVIWDRTANLPFINNITGIGRDDNSALDQRQSKSINTGSIITMYNGAYNGNNFPVLNTDNNNSFTADNSFLLFGDNGLSTALTRCYSLGTVGFLRMSRVWKIQKTGTVGTFTIAVKATDLPANVKNLLVSTDSAFSSGNTVSYPLDNNNGYLTKSISISGNAYFTYAADSLVAHPTSNSPLCVGSTIQLNSNLSTPGNLQWTGPNSYTSTATNPTIVGATAANAGVYTLTGTISGCPIQPGFVAVQVSPMPAPPTVVTPVIYCTGDPATAVTAVGQDLLWYYSPIGGSGASAPPVPSTLAADTITYWVTQSNNGCESIRSKLDVFVRTKPNGIILASRSTVCQYDTVSFQYFGNAQITDQYDWQSSYPGASIISGSGQGPLVVRFDTVGTQTVRMQVNHEGCVSPEALYQVQVNAAPQLRTTIKDTACANETVMLSLNYATPGIDSYTWDFDGGAEQYGTANGGPFGIKWANDGLKQISVIAKAKGCPSLKYLDTIQILPLPYAHIDFVSNTNICSGDTISLIGNQFLTDSTATYKWTPSIYVGTPADSQRYIFAKVAYSSQIGFQIIDRYGCKGADSVYINANPCCQVYLPDAFTPNNDGRNDLFKIITNGNHQLITFRIFNRWGQVVFETADETKGWDGTFGGKIQEMGTYFYYVKYKCVTGREFETKGELTLVR